MSETTKNLQQENKMGVMPVNRLIISMSLPMMVSMLVQAMYNIVDSMFVAKLGEDALTALSLAFPMQNFMIAVGSGTGVGVNALVSGRKEVQGSEPWCKQRYLSGTVKCDLFLRAVSECIEVVIHLAESG